MTILMNEHKSYICSLYRKFIKLSFDWNLERSRYRAMAVSIRKQFNKHKNETDPIKVAFFVRQAEYLLYYYQHPEPYNYPSSPKGVNWEREERVPIEVAI